MTITTVDGIIAAAKQRVLINRSASRTAVAAAPFSVFDLAGVPGSGVLAGTSTTTGVVPTDATAGCPTINAFGGSNTGYISRIEGNSQVSCRIQLYDMLWKAGAYAFNVSTSGNSPTSYSSRVPGGTDYTGLELWLEQVTAGTLVQNVNVNYNNESGAAHSTGVIACPAAMIVGRMFQLPLLAGDKGIQGVTGVAGSVASAGTFNLLVMRPLGEVRIRVANDGIVQDALSTGLPIVFTDSALVMIVSADSTATSVPELVIDVING
jgi:hypothetical protein